MVGKDGYCPMGHLARPDLQVEKPRVASPPPAAPAPPPVPAEPAVPEHDPYTPPGLGPSNPPPQAAAPPTEGSVPTSGSFAPAGIRPPAAPAPPPVPGEAPPSLPVARKSRGGKTAFVVVAAFLAVALFGILFLGRSAGAANLKYVFTPGEAHRYQMSMEMDIHGGNLLGSGNFKGTVEMIMRQRVTGVDKAGVATIEFALERLSVSQGGKSQKVPLPSDVIEIRMTPDGRVLDTSGTEFLGEINPAAGIFGPESFSPILPRSKVDPGDSWSIGGDVPNPFGNDFHVDGTATYVERTGTGDQEAAVIRSTIDSPLDLRMELGKIAEANGDSLGNIPSNAVMTFDGNISMNLTQAMATKSGFLKSALGEMKMTGTIGFENVPQIGNITGVLNMTVQLTLTALS